MKRRLLIVPAAVAVSLGVAGTASANAHTVDADCAGLSFTMPRGEDGTVVTTRLDGRTVRTDTIATFGAPLSFTIASPDQSIGHTWSVTVDSRWNADTSWSEAVPACTSPTSSTVPPAPTTTASPSPATTVVAVTSPPVAPATTVVTPPRSTTTTTPSSQPTLPATGFPAVFATLLAATLVVVGAVGTAVEITRDRKRS